MIRPMRHETVRYGNYSKAGEFVYDRPFQWGSRRIGPDLHRAGKTLTQIEWHLKHFWDPRSTSDGKSIMPRYHALFDSPIEYDSIQARVDALVTLGTPYGERAQSDAAGLAREQANAMYEQLIAEATEPERWQQYDLPNQKVLALTAYLLRLGTDIDKPLPAEVPEDESAVARATAPHGEDVNDVQ